MIQTIEIIVSTKGETRLETKGFVGAACREASRFLVATLGQTASELLTAEYHQAAQAERLHERHDA